MELKNNNVSGWIQLPPLTPIDTTQPTQPTQDIQQNSLLQQAVDQKQQIDEDMKNKLKEIRYKIYIFFMLLIWLLSFPYFSKALSSYESYKTQITDSESKKKQAEQDLTNVEKNIKLVQDVKIISSWSWNSDYSQQEAKYIKECLLIDEQDSAKCKNVPENVRTNTNFIEKNKDLLRNIALLKWTKTSNPWSWSVSNFDQKKVLQWLYEEIIGVNVMKKAKSTIFWEKTLVKFSDKDDKIKLYKVPITINVVASYNELKDILKNVEKTIVYKNLDLANLYDVKTVSYDIWKAKTSDSSSDTWETEQELNLNIDTYFYEN